jgi:hypothetical protein
MHTSNPVDRHCAVNLRNYLTSPLLALHPPFATTIATRFRQYKHHPSLLSTTRFSIQTCSPRDVTRVSTRTRSRKCAPSQLKYPQHHRHRLSPHHPGRRHPRLSLTWRFLHQLILPLTALFHRIPPRHNPVSTPRPLSPKRTLSHSYLRHLFLTACTPIPILPHQT